MSKGADIAGKVTAKTNKKAALPVEAIVVPEEDVAALKKKSSSTPRSKGARKTAESPVKSAQRHSKENLRTPERRSRLQKTPLVTPTTPGTGRKLYKAEQISDSEEEGDDDDSDRDGKVQKSKGKVERSPKGSKGAKKPASRALFDVSRLEKSIENLKESAVPGKHAKKVGGGWQRRVGGVGF